MLARLTPLLMAAAVAVLMLALARMGEAMKQLKGRIDSLEAPPAEPEPDLVHPPGFHGVRRPMLGAIIEESPSPLEGIGRWPGGRLALAAGGLALLGAFGAVLSSGPRPDPKAAAELTAVRARLDSLQTALTALKAADTATVLAAATGQARAAEATPPKRAPTRPVPAPRVVAANRTKGASDRPRRGATLPPPPSLTGAPPVTKIDSIR